MAFSVIWRRRGYGGFSNLIYGSNRVSRSFSSAESVSTNRRMSPWLMLPPRREGEDVVYKFFSLAENRVLSFNWSLDPNLSDFYPNDDLAKLVGESPPGYDPDDDDDPTDLVGSTHGWLGLKSHYAAHLGLINPLTRRHVKLPARDIPESSYPSWTASNLVISCSPDNDEEEEGECRALKIYGANKLAFCCPGRSPRWTGISDDENYDSFVYSKRQKLFFCARRDEQVMYLEGWDLRDPLSPKLVLNDPKLTLNDPNLSLERDRRRPPQRLLTEYYLVINEDTDGLFLVRRFTWLGLGDDDDSRYREYYDDDDYGDYDIPYKTVAFDVYKYDLQSGTLRYMDGGSLDGLSFFIGTNDGFALPAAEFPELKPDSIYFTDCWSPMPFDDRKFGGHDVGIFDYRDSKISPCYYPCDLPSFKMLSPPPRWFTPKFTTKAN